MQSNPNRVLIKVLEKYCPTPMLTEAAKRELAKCGFRILGYNAEVLGVEG